MLVGKSHPRMGGEHGAEAGPPVPPPSSGHHLTWPSILLQDNQPVHCLPYLRGISKKFAQPLSSHHTPRRGVQSGQERSKGFLSGSSKPRLCCLWEFILSCSLSLSLSPSRSCSLSFLLSLTPSHIPVGFKGTPEAVSIWEDRMNEWVAFTTSPSQENALSPLCHFRSWFAHVPVPRCWLGRVWMWSRLVALRSACNRAERGSSP